MQLSWRLAPVLCISLLSAAFPRSAPAFQLELAISGERVAGQPVQLSASAAGGVAPYSYAFDLDSDGQFEVRQPGGELEVTWPTARTGVLRVTATDATNVTETTDVALQIDGLALQVTSGQRRLTCGDGDSDAEPGETWTFPLTVRRLGGDNGEVLLPFVPQDRIDAALRGESVASAATVSPQQVRVPALAQEVAVSLSVTLSASATCGTAYPITYFGAGGARGFTAPGVSPATVLVTPPSDRCQAYAGFCGGIFIGGRPKQGFYFDPLRPGNGLGSFVIERDGGREFFATWFTGDELRRPSWYVVQGVLQDNQVVAPLLRFRRTSAPGATPFTVQSAVAGVAVATITGNDTLSFAYRVGPRFGAEQLRFLTTGSAPVPNRTGAWFSPPESGWGQVAHEYFDGATSLPSTFVIDYLYDDAGEPRWVLGQAASADFTTGVPHATFKVQCPGCPWIANPAFGAGSGSIEWTSPTQARTSTRFQLPAELGQTTWNRDLLPIELLTTPQ